MAILVEDMSAPTAGGGIRAFIDTESWELVTTGVDDFHKPVAEREPLKDVLQEWQIDPSNVSYDGVSLARLISHSSTKDRMPHDLNQLFQATLQADKNGEKK